MLLFSLLLFVLLLMLGFCVAVFVVYNMIVLVRSVAYAVITVAAVC